MRSFIWNSTRFLAFLILVIIPIGLFISSLDNLDKSVSDNHNIISLQTKSEYDSLDVLFVGNSYTYSSINTILLDTVGIKSFNLGIATAGIQFYELVVNDYLDNVNSPPEKILFQLSLLTFSSKADNFVAYPIHRYLDTPRNNLALAMKYNRLNDLLSLYRRSIKKGSQNLFARNHPPLEERLNLKGFKSSNDTVNAKIIASNQYAYITLKDEIFDKDKVDRLIAFVRELRNSGHQIAFYDIPTYALKDYFNQNYKEAYSETLERLREEFEVIKFDTSILTRDNFRNIDHMNDSGAGIITKQMTKLLYGN